MNTSFHFASAQEISPAILDIIKRAYQEKPVSIYIQEEETVVPQWQIQEVRRRDAIMGDNPACLLDADSVIDELQKELEII
jgi:hypothetical protein